MSNASPESVPTDSVPIVETVVATGPLEVGAHWTTLVAGNGLGEHDQADVYLVDERSNKRVICRCGATCSAAPGTLAYRLGANTAPGRSDMFAQHQRSVRGLCVRCGRQSCHCANTDGW